MTNWHRLFGIMLSDVFTGSPYDVEMEVDLSLKQQFLDIVVIRKKPGDMTVRLPDGLDNLADHNLVSFKSHREPFDVWAINELIGHYVNYRKQINAADEPMPPEDHFRLYGVCARYPAQLAGSVAINQLQPGVLECNIGVTVRLIVLRDLPDEEHNAALHLFSADRNKIQYGQEHFRQRSPTTSTIIQRLFGEYLQEGLNMPYTIEDFKREAYLEALNEIPVKEFLAHPRVQELLEDMPLDKRLEGVPLEKRLEGVANEQLLARMTPEEIEAYLKKLKSDPPANAE